jgi:hypothetical protein
VRRGKIICFNGLSELNTEGGARHAIGVLTSIWDISKQGVRCIISVNNKHSLKFSLSNKLGIDTQGYSPPVDISALSQLIETTCDGLTQVSHAVSLANYVSLVSIPENSSTRQYHEIFQKLSYY